MADQDPYNNCLLTQVAGFINEEITTLVDESTAVQQRIQMIIASGVLGTSTFWKYLGMEVLNSDLSKAVITKVEEQALNSAMALGESTMKYEINGKTIAQYLSTYREVTVGAVRLVQMLTSFPIFMVGVIKLSLDNLKDLCEKEEHYSLEVVRISNELKKNLSTTFGEDFSEKFRKRVEMARGALVATQRPTITVLAEMGSGQGVNKTNLEKIRSNLYVAKASLIQDKAAAKADARVQNISNFWENVSTDIVGTADEAWSEFKVDLVSQAQETIDLEKEFWSNYTSLVANHMKIRTTMAGIKATSTMILQASNFVSSKLVNSTGLTDSIRGAYLAKLFAMKEDIDSIIVEMNGFLDRTSDGIDLAEQYPMWVGKLALYTNSVVNAGFDIAGGWIDSGDDFKQDYDTLRALKGQIVTLESDDPSLYQKGNISFFALLNSIHVGFPKAIRGKGSIESAQNSLNKAVINYFSWITEVKALTTYEFESYEDLSEVITALEALGLGGIVQALKSGNVQDIITNSALGGGVIDIVINCIIKKKQEADTRASAEDKKNSQMFETLLKNLEKLKIKRECAVDQQVTALKEQMDQLNIDIREARAALKALERILLASVTLGISLAEGEGANSANLAIATAMTNPGD